MTSTDFVKDMIKEEVKYADEYEMVNGYVLVFIVDQNNNLRAFNVSTAPLGEFVLNEELDYPYDAACYFESGAVEYQEQRLSQHNQI